MNSEFKQGSNVLDIETYLFSYWNQKNSELAKRNIRANGNIYHIFKPNKLRDVQNFFQDKTSMDMSIDEVPFLIFTCWVKKSNFLTLIWPEAILPVPVVTK